MAFANSTFTDLVTTTARNRSKVVGDNVTKNNGLLTYLKKRGKVKTFSGGTEIVQPLLSAENGNASFFSGYDPLPVAAQDVITAANFAIKQAAVAVPISGLDRLVNSGENAILDLAAERMEVAEASLANIVSVSLYSDGTGYGGKELTGLGAAVVALPTSGTYGGIDRGTTIGTFWRNQYTGSLGAQSAGATFQTNLGALYVKCCRGKDRPNLLISGNSLWSIFEGTVQALQRFTSPETADMGFPTLKYKGADFIMDGGIGGAEATNVIHMLNLDYLFWRPHVDCNFVPLEGERYSTNQDAQVVFVGVAGNLTCSGAQFQGYFQGS